MAASSISSARSYRKWEGVMNKKPAPLCAQATRRCCPVCGEVTYSAAGIHPQCAVRQADAIRLDRVKAEKSAPKPIPSSPTLDVRPWQKICPKCRVVVHVRKKACDCGHVFAMRARPPLESSRR
jgi:hypothetical protein